MLIGSRVRLEPLTPAHAPTLASWERDVVNTRAHLSNPAMPSSIETWERRIREDNQSPSTYSFGIFSPEDDELIGQVALSGVTWNHRHCGLGIVLAANHQGQGAGTQALRLILDFAFDELNLHRVEIGVFSFNEGAIRLYERLGFVHEGRAREWGRRDGQWFDLVHMGMLEDAYRGAR